MKRRTLETGHYGETLAADFLRGRGYEVLATNWRCRYGELDIVARDGDTLVFVEVRTRSATSTEPAFESIGPRKQARLTAAINLYLAAFALAETSWRVDVIAIALARSGPPVVDHVENALDW